jgi:hypothetical protein
VSDKKRESKNKLIQIYHFQMLNQHRLDKQPIHLSQLVWSRYLERKRWIKGEAIKNLLN